MSIKLLLRALLMVSLIGPLMFAQQTVIKSPKAQRVVDGKATPDLIPDDIANRMVLLSFSVSSANAPREVARQNAHLLSLGIEGTEADAVRAVLKSFRAEYDDFQARQKTEKIRGASAIKNALVHKAMNNLSQVLTAQHLAALSRYVQERKNHMITTEVAQ